MPPKGYKHSDETKLKIRLVKLGKTSSRKGVKLSGGIKKKISESKKGSIPWNKNKKDVISEEARQKMSDSTYKHIDNGITLCLKYHDDEDIHRHLERGD